jgi:hypothetical protein
MNELDEDEAIRNMRKLVKILPPFLLLLSLFLLINAQVALVHASPGPASYQASPTNHDTAYYTISSGAWTDAYDGNNGTSVSFVYSSYDRKNTAYLNMTPFSTSSFPWRITKVDFKMKYTATVQSSKGETYTIYYRVGSSGTVTLVAATGNPHSVPAAGCDVWASQAEPNDGVWDWADVGNIEFVVESPFINGATGVFSLYEAWVTVTYRGTTLCVDPTDQSVSGAFTVDINLTEVVDLYGWEFNITYDTTKLTASDAQEGPFLKSGGSTQFNKTINDANGWVYVYASLIGDIAGVSGSGDLANITFSIDNTGTDIPLDFNNKTKLIEYDFVTKTTTMYFSDTTLCTYPPYYVCDVDGKVTITAIPEFPLGGIAEIALAAVVIFLWWKHTQTQSPDSSAQNPLT